MLIAAGAVDVVVVADVVVAAVDPEASFVSREDLSRDKLPSIR